MSPLPGPGADVIEPSPSLGTLGWGRAATDVSWGPGYIVRSPVGVRQGGGGGVQSWWATGTQVPGDPSLYLDPEPAPHLLGLSTLSRP